MKRIHIVQHVSFESPARIAAWARERGHASATTRVYEQAVFPPVYEMDALVVMGGPMSVHDDERIPWLVAEKRLIAGAVEAGCFVLGVCLGAQLIASVAGARVHRNRFKEVGWFDVEATREGRSHPRFGLPPVFGAFHWHDETFQLPAGAVQLARTEACEQQMFAIGDRVLAMQFHLEMEPAGIDEMVVHAAGDLTEGPFVQAKDQLAAGAGDACRASHRLLDRLLDAWIAGGDT